MAVLPTGVTPQDFYENPAFEDLQGSYQYVTLADVINNFELMYVGDDKLINNINRDIVLFHAKRGLQEANFDILKEIKGIEIDLSETLTLILPEDYVKYVRVSWVDKAGNFRPMVMNDDTKIAEAYLQDNNYNILFDESGNVLKAADNSYDQTNLSSYSISKDSGVEPSELIGARFGLNTAKANSNGWFTVDKANGVMKFDSKVGTRTIVLEYISDGLESSDPTRVRVHKFAEEALYTYIEWMILNSKMGIQEYIVKRKRKDYDVARRKAKMRLNGITFDDIMQAMRGKDKRIK
tara:strand:- start:1 stop:882 length:882 start_codon:yes stop_codon:yes gene_type:complete